MIPSPDSAAIRLDSDDFGAARDMRLWREAVARSILGLDFKALDGKPFRARMRANMLGEATLSTMQISPALTLRDRELADHNDNAYVFVVAGQGPVVAGQRGREDVMRRGQATLLATDETGQITSPRGGAYTAVLVPKSRLVARAPGADRRIMELIHDSAPRLQLVRQYMQLCLRTARTADADLRAAMGQHLVDLIALALEAGTDPRDLAGQDGAEAARLQLIRAAIAENVDDCGLSLGRVSAACGLSPRSVQLALERAGTSYSEMVLSLRLERAFAMLFSQPDMRIIDVALACGFADVSYFNRRFRARFGDTPSGIRAGRG